MEDQKTISPSDYEEIDKLVLRYQSGDSKAAERLIVVFEPLIKKYYSIIRTECISYNDWDTRRFLRLFCPSKEIRKRFLHKPFMMRYKQYIEAALTALHRMCDPLPSEDIRQELITQLLEIAHKYKPPENKRSSFCNYLEISYPFYIYRAIMKLTREPCAYNTEHSVSYDAYRYIIEKTSVYRMEDSCINSLLCNQALKMLDPIQKYILDMYYNQGLNDTSISKIMGYSRQYIHRIRQEAENIIAAQLGPEYKRILTAKSKRHTKDAKDHTL